MDKVSQSNSASAEESASAPTAASQPPSQRVLLARTLMTEPGMVSVSTWVGSGVPRFYLPLDQIFPQANVTQYILLPKGLAEREELRKRLPADAKVLELLKPGIPALLVANKLDEVHRRGDPGIEREALRGIGRPLIEKPGGNLRELELVDVRL